MMDQPQTYSISQMHSEFAVTPRTLRYYEELGLLQPERRGQHRLYHERDRVRLRLVLRGRRLGFSLAQIREMIDLYDIDPSERRQLERTVEYGRRRIGELERKRAEIDTALAELRGREAWCRGALAAIEAAADPGQRPAATAS